MQQVRNCNSLPPARIPHVGLVWRFSSDRSSNSRGVNNRIAAHGQLFSLHLVLLYHLVAFRRDIVNMGNSGLAHTLEADIIACLDKGSARTGCCQLSLLDKTAEVRRINFRDLIMVKVSVIFSGISQYLSPVYHGPDGLRGRTSGTLSCQIVLVSETLPTLSFSESVTTLTKRWGTVERLHST